MSNAPNHWPAVFATADVAALAEMLARDPHGAAEFLKSATVTVRGPTAWLLKKKRAHARYKEHRANGVPVREAAALIADEFNLPWQTAWGLSQRGKPD